MNPTLPKTLPHQSGTTILTSPIPMKENLKLLPNTLRPLRQCPSSQPEAHALRKSSHHSEQKSTIALSLLGWSDSKTVELSIGNGPMYSPAKIQRNDLLIRLRQSHREGLCHRVHARITVDKVITSTSLPSYIHSSDHPPAILPASTRNS